MTEQGLVAPTLSFEEEWELSKKDFTVLLRDKYGVEQTIRLRSHSSETAYDVIAWIKKYDARVTEVSEEGLTKPQEYNT